MSHNPTGYKLTEDSEILKTSGHILEIGDKVMMNILVIGEGDLDGVEITSSGVNYWRYMCQHPNEVYTVVGFDYSNDDETSYILVGTYSGARELARSFLLLNRTCFSGIVVAGPMGGKTADKKDFLSRWNSDSLRKRIGRISELSSRIEVHRMDCCDFVESLAYWYPDATLFVDPPYYQKGPALYPSAFSAEDHRRLADTLNALHAGMPGPDIIITYDDCPEIRELYPFADVEEVQRVYSIAN